MKIGSPAHRVLSESPCAELASAILSTQKRWAELAKKLESCVTKVSQSQEYVVDPFSVARLAAEIRSDALAIGVDPELLSIAEAWASDQANAQILGFDRQLRQLCASEALSVSGRFPSYVLADYLNIRLVTDKGFCIVGSKKIRSLFIHRIWVEVLSSAREEAARQLRPETLLTAFHLAYRRLIARHDRAVGSAIPIWDLYKEVASLIGHREAVFAAAVAQLPSKYTKEFFSRDLGRLMRLGRFLTGDGARMELFPTSFAREGISVHTAEGERIVGGIGFGAP